MPRYGKNTPAGRLEVCDVFVRMGHREWLPVFEYPDGRPDHHWYNAAVLILSGHAEKITLCDECELRIACQIGLSAIRFHDLHKQWMLLVRKIEKDWISRDQATEKCLAEKKVPIP